MQIVDKTISVSELQTMAENSFGEMVKAVVDLDKGLMAVDEYMHADLEKILLEHGSEQSQLWGINLHPFESKEDWIEFDSMINIRPWANNRSRSVEDPMLRDKITQLVQGLVQA